jgi:hypothetical protein
MVRNVFFSLENFATIGYRVLQPSPDRWPSPQ